MDPVIPVSSHERIYLDHAATTPLSPAARDAMAGFWREGGGFGNPSGVHREARAARRALDDTRELIGDDLGVEAGNVIFTSGGTESDNLAIIGGWAARMATGRDTFAGLPSMVVAAFEHHAVLEAARAAAASDGFVLHEVPSTADGLVDLDALEAVLDDRVAFVSVMAANNEVGTVQPMAAVSSLVRRHAPSAWLHTDAVQAAPWCDLAPLMADVDLLSISAHKFGGPSGTGVLALGPGAGVHPVIHGGGQERERRSGTPDVASVLGMGAAWADRPAGHPDQVAAVTRRRQRLEGILVARVPGLAVSGAEVERLPNITHLRISGVEAEALVLLADEAGLAISAGASCASGALQPSHVLLAMGCPEDAARSGVRISLGTGTSEAEVDRVAEVFPGLVARLRD
jgi:cysteine desulfurase